MCYLYKLPTMKCYLDNYSRVMGTWKPILLAMAVVSYCSCQELLFQQSNMKTAALLLLAITFYLDSTSCANLTPTKPSLVHHSQAQYVHDKEDSSIKAEQTSEEEQQDPYEILNELKPERMPPHFSGWNPYQQHHEATMQHNKFLPFVGYPQPIFIPYPFLISPEMLYEFNGQNEIEDSMSRTSNRRPANYRNSPIYYVRLPPTPYMFIPGLGYTSQPGTFAPNFSPLVPYNSYPTLSSILNLPVNFLANGKPTGIYQMGSASDLQGQLPTLPPQRPSSPGPSYRPSYLPQPSYMSQQSSFMPPQPSYMSPMDTKMTHLKRPFVFNGRPEDIYILRNNFNALQSMYQDPLSNYF